MARGPFYCSKNTMKDKEEKIVKGAIDRTAFHSGPRSFRRVWVANHREPGEDGRHGMLLEAIRQYCMECLSGTCFGCVFAPYRKRMWAEREE